MKESTIVQVETRRWFFLETDSKESDSEIRLRFVKDVSCAKQITIPPEILPEDLKKMNPSDSALQELVGISVLRRDSNEIK